MKKPGHAELGHGGAFLVSPLLGRRNATLNATSMRRVTLVGLILLFCDNLHVNTRGSFRRVTLRGGGVKKAGRDSWPQCTL